MEKAAPSRRVLVVLLHFLCVLVRDCFVYGRNSVPCPVVNKLTGAVVCCPSAEGTLQTKGCQTLYPNESLPLLPGTWSVESYTEAKSSWLQQLTLEIVNSSCCCRENVDLVLPDQVASVSGSRKAKVVQHSAGYVQPVFVRTCGEQSCSSGGTENTVFSCTQKWTWMDLYTEDQLYSSFMHLEKVLIPDGCSCREQQAEIGENSKSSGSSFKEDFDGIKDSFSVRIPVSSSNELPRPGELGAGHRTLKDNAKSNVFKRDAIAAKSSEPDIYLEASDIRIPSSILVDYNSSSYKDNDDSSYLKDILAAYISQNLPLVSLEQSEGEHYFTDTGGSGINLKGLSDLVNKSQGRDELFLHSIFQNSSSSSCKDSRNCSSSEHSSKYSDSDLNSTGHQQPTALLPGQQNDSIKSSQLANLPGVSNVLDVMKYNLKLGLLGGTFGRMTTAELMKNILNHVPENERAYAQSAAEKMMVTEMEYLKTSLKMLEIILNSTGSLEDVVNTPKLSPNIKESGKAPLISRPDINSPNRFESVNAPIYSNPTFQGNKENIEDNFRKELSLGTNQNKNLSVGLIQLEKGDLHFNRSLLPTISQVGNLPVTPEASQPSSGSGFGVTDRMEEELHAAFANFVFQEAWANLSCRVPQTISKSVSEVNFLPSLIRKQLHPEAKGVLDINKFTGRIITGIIMCHIPDLEEALKDGRLATAISGGVMAADLLNKQVKIIKGVMQGLLDTSDAKKIAGILKWSVKSTGGLPRGEFLNSKDELQMDNLLTTLNNSLSKYAEFLKGKISSDKVHIHNFPANLSSILVLGSASSPGSPGDASRSETAPKRTTPGAGTVTTPTATPPSVGNLTSSTAKPPGSTPEVNRTESTPIKTTPGVSNGTSTATPSSAGSATTSITTPTSVGTATSPTATSPSAGNVTTTATLPSGGNGTSTATPPSVGNVTTTPPLNVGNVTSSTTPSHVGNTSRSSTTNIPTPAETRVSTVPPTTAAPGSSNTVSPNPNVTHPIVNVTTPTPRQDITNGTTLAQGSSTTRNNVTTTPPPANVNGTQPSITHVTNSPNSTVSLRPTEVTKPSRNRTKGTESGIYILGLSSTTQASGGTVDTKKNRTGIDGNQDYEYKDYEYNDYGYVDDTLGGYFGNKHKHKHNNGTHRESLETHKDKRLENTNASESASANTSIIFGGGNKVHANRPTAVDKIVNNRNDTGKGPQMGKEEDVDYDYKDPNNYLGSYGDYENERGLFKVKEEAIGSNDVYEAHSVRPSVSKEKHKDSADGSDGTDSDYGNGNVDYKNDELVGDLLYSNEEKVKNNVAENNLDDREKLKDNEEKKKSDGTATINGYDRLINEDDEPKNTDEDIDILPDSDDELRNESDQGSHHHHHDQSGSVDADDEEEDGGPATSGDWENDLELPEEYNPIDMAPLNLQMLFSNLNL